MFEQIQETAEAEVVETHLDNTISTEDTVEIYEAMSASQDMIMKYTDCSEDIYESMLEIDPECAEDLCKINCYLLVLIVMNLTTQVAAEEDLFLFIYFFR